MSIRMAAIVAIVVMVLAMFGAILVERSLKSDCVRAGIQVGWATEAIKELCK